MLHLNESSSLAIEDSLALLEKQYGEAAQKKAFTIGLSDDNGKQGGQKEYRYIEGQYHLQSDETYVNNALHGTSRDYWLRYEYTEDGQKSLQSFLQKEYVYDHGSLKSATNYDEGEVTTYIDKDNYSTKQYYDIETKRHLQSESITKSGYTKSKKNYAFDGSIMDEKQYNDHGILQHQINYDADESIRNEQHYDANGKLERQTEYIKDSTSKRELFFKDDKLVDVQLVKEDGTARSFKTSLQLIQFADNLEKILSPHKLKYKHLASYQSQELQRRHSTLRNG